MFLLLGSHTLAGQAFAAELRLRGQSFVASNLEEANYADLNILFDQVRRIKPSFIINAGCLTGGINRELSATDRANALCANVLVPQAVARVCQMRNIPWGHVSSGSIFRGARVFKDGQWLTEIDLHRPEMRLLLESKSRRVRGFIERDEPNHCFQCPPCNFYSGAIALGEEAIRDIGYGYIWRAGAVFLDQHHQQNLLSRARLLGDASGSTRGPDGENGFPSRHRFLSVTHLGEFARTCLDLWARQVPYGTYHLVNPGVVDTQTLSRQTCNGQNPHSSEQQRLSQDSSESAPPQSFLLESSKLEAMGISLRPAVEAIQTSLEAMSRQGEEAKENSGIHYFSASAR